MSPPPRGIDRDPFVEALERVNKGLERAEDRAETSRGEIVELRLAVGALQAERGEILRRVGELEAWRREESVTRGGVAFGAWRGLLLASVSLAALAVGVINLARGC